jgi:hypothetical protein
VPLEQATDPFELGVLGVLELFVPLLDDLELEHAASVTAAAMSPATAPIRYSFTVGPLRQWLCCHRGR